MHQKQRGRSIVSLSFKGNRYGPVVYQRYLHVCTERTRCYLFHRRFAKSCDEGVEEVQSSRRFESLKEIRSPTLGGLSEKGELRDREDLSLHFGHILVELFGFVFEDPHLDDLVDHRPNARLTVSLTEADEEDEAVTNLADDRTIDRDARFFDSLENYLHEGRVAQVGVGLKRFAAPLGEDDFPKSKTFPQTPRGSSSG